MAVGTEQQDVNIKVSICKGWAICRGDDLQQVCRYPNISNSVDRDDKLVFDLKKYCTFHRQNVEEKLPCELKVCLNESEAELTSIDIVSTSGVCEAFRKTKADAEPSYLLTARGTPVDDGRGAGAASQFRRITVPLDPEAAPQELRLRMLSIRGDKDKLLVSGLWLRRGSAANRAGPQPNLAAAGPPPQPAEAPSSQMDGVRGILDSFLAGQEPGGPGPSPAALLGAAGGLPPAAPLGCLLSMLAAPRRRPGAGAPVPGDGAGPSGDAGGPAEGSLGAERRPPSDGHSAPGAGPRIEQRLVRIEAQLQELAAASGRGFAEGAALRGWEQRLERLELSVDTIGRRLDRVLELLTALAGSREGESPARGSAGPPKCS
uniref:Uncharacterized protein n=1 Tax=Tetraselmis sp. GSL018 TaxID=582737 RepID=A0A061SKH4_9CHLO|eukprot:CAMPEP_0177584442 /NCGR_PEP_ID=MMETSP0419_2-20121207/3897_1 /TAXON_ID=582737 /ORGANISM="Tetraselmis sp., Strain GSL018" /LENGTH=374 /DNA_ID=CAMNT_0019073979 /DNA_START=105 /DNA_END=1229 /DNA_ORIENTATION=-